MGGCACGRYCVSDLLLLCIFAFDNRARGFLYQFGHGVHLRQHGCVACHVGGPAATPGFTPRLHLAHSVMHRRLHVPGASFAWRARSRGVCSACPSTCSLRCHPISTGLRRAGAIDRGRLGLHLGRSGARKVEARRSPRSATSTSDRAPRAASSEIQGLQNRPRLLTTTSFVPHLPLSPFLHLPYPHSNPTQPPPCPSPP